MLRSILVVAIAVVCIITTGGCTTAVEDTNNINGNNEEGIWVHVHVLLDQPDNIDYQIREGKPKSAGVWEFYFKQPNLPGTGAFREVDSIPLVEAEGGRAYGEKYIKRIDGWLCVGFPSTNFIDGKTCVEINQTQDEVSLTVHYWKTNIAILK
jgi:hypothetical protein